MKYTNRYYELHSRIKDNTATEFEYNEFREICVILLHRILEENMDVLYRLKNA